MYYGEQQRKLGINEFKEVLTESLSKVVIPQNYINREVDFFEQIFFKTYEKYHDSKIENYSINQIRSLLEIFIDALFTYQPSNKKPDDLINIS